MAPRWIFAAAIALLFPVSNAETSAVPENLEVDLGYGIFRGTANDSTGLNTWLGIRYAEPPIGNLRWQGPQLPSTNLTVTDATNYGSECPQSYPGDSVFVFAPQSEDCLFLNIWSPKNATNLPVLVWIHGGGYGFGNGQQDMSTLINANNNSFIGVSIQYRLGVFGFLSSQEVMDRGVVNAGLLDQAFALTWVEAFIKRFGGNQRSVTISGESSGGGSVMLHSLAGDAAGLGVPFQSAIAASPYLPTQWEFNDTEPTNRYHQFATEVGCAGNETVFDCLVSKDSVTLQTASNAISQGQTAYGEWAFLPVTDGLYVFDRPSVLLEQKKVNAKRLLVGNNANEGGLFAHNPVAPLLTEAQVRAWLPQHFPNLEEADIDNILALYPAGSIQLDVGQETNGLTAPYANNVSQDAVGQQQRANNIYAESTFVCPSYWLASGYTGENTTAYHYQYSVPFAEHQADISAYFGPALPNQSEDFVLAFRKIWGNFITKNNPSITNAEAVGVSVSAADTDAPNAATDFPVWTDMNPMSINLNETGGVPYETNTTWLTIVTQYMEPGLRNDITSFDAYSWEAGRGARCDYWKSIGSKIMK
ncbi:inactive carboxylesterase 4 [Xylariaceae sp. FL0016]|nr:inactive carboxylesterase 4 [Xylariaceae sp. FL0016]